MTEGGSGRLLAVGLDAAPLELLRHWIGTGLMPNLGRLLEGAQIAPVTHAESFRAELPWTAFLTAVDPATLNYWGTVRFDARTYGVLEGGALRAEPFYARLGVPVVVLDAPHSVPWPDVPGVQVCAWGAHSPQHPPAAEPFGWHDALVRRFGPHPAGDADSTPGWHQPSYLRWLARSLVSGARRRADAMAWLCQQQPDWRFGLVVFSELHSAGHHLWHAIAEHPLGPDPQARALFERVAVGIDGALGHLLGEVPAERTVVFSVHGVAPNASDLPASYLAPELVHRLHWGWRRLAAPKPIVAAAAPLRPRSDTALGSVIGEMVTRHRKADPSSPPDSMDVLRTRLAGLRPRWDREIRFGPSAPLAEGADVAPRPIDYLGPVLWAPFWRYQRVFVLPSFSDVHLRVNLAGREANGQVQPDDYAAELDRWERELCRLRHPGTTSPPKLSFSRPRLADPFAPEGPPPDLAVVFEDVTDRLEHPDAGLVGPLPFLRTGEHGGPGFVAAPVGAMVLPATLTVVELAELIAALVPSAR